MTGIRSTNLVTHYHTALRLGVLFLIALSTTASYAQVGFRVETDIFSESFEQPVSQTVTRFLDGIGYDESRDADQDITMVDPARDRIVRLNEAEKLRTVVKITKLHELLKLAEAQAQSSKLAVFVAGAAQVKADDDEVTVGASPLIYQATLDRPSDLQEAKQFALTYRQFADATKLLNCFSGRSDPPFARLALNEAVQQKNALPKQIDLTAERGGEEVHIKCVLNANWLLSKADRKRISEIQSMVATFEDVTPEEYNRRTQKMQVGHKPSTVTK